MIPMLLQADLTAQFEGAFSGAAGAATLAPLILALGAVLLLLIDILPTRGLRPFVVVAAFVGALWASACQVADPAGAVLGGIYNSTAGTALFGIIFALGGLLAWVYSLGYYKDHLKGLLAEHDMLFLSAPAGMMLMVGASDLLVFFIGLEILSLPLYALTAFRRRRTDSVEGGLKYFLLGAFASAFYLFGASLLFVATGSLSLTGLAAASSGSLATTPIFLAGAGLLMAGLFFKVSVFPFHLWVPDVYQGAPTPVTTLMATGTKAAAFGFMIPLAFILPVQATGMIAAVALLTMAAGNLAALVQTNLKRMMAYSGIAHAGTILLVVVAYLASGHNGDAHQAGYNAALFYLGAYLFTSTGTFGLMAMLEREGEDKLTLAGMRGLAQRRPVVASAMTLFMLSLGGIPMTGGFFGKWFVFVQLVEQDMIGVAVLGALMSVIALGYYLRVIVTMWMQPLDDASDANVAAPQALPASIATFVCALGVLAMGLLPGWFLGLLG